MALFDGKSKDQQPEQQSEQKQEQQPMGDQSYFDDLAGSGQEQLTADMLSTPYLSMTQARSQRVKDGEMEVATWYNSASGENFGPTVEVVMLAAKTAWIERDTVNKTWVTVGRYPPNDPSIEVIKTMPKPGQRGFPTLINKQSGNKIEELFVYAVMLPDRPEVGVLYFSPTAMSMSGCKAWNTKIRNQRLPSGKLAPIFAFSWILGLEVAGTNENTRLCSSTRGKIVALDLFKEYVQPQLSQSQNLLMLAAPAGDEEGSVE